jgi:hypothetical protein
MATETATSTGNPKVNKPGRSTTASGQRAQSKANKTSSSGTGASRRGSPPNSSIRRQGRNGSPPSWLSAVISVVGVGVAVGAGLYATRKQWMPMAEGWRDEFAAAFADDETDYENFDQTRHAGTSSMRDYPGDDWEDIDDMSDASFPASDPPRNRGRTAWA